MRTVIPHPLNESQTCADCGKRGGLLYRSVYRVLDFGVPGMAPIEPGDLGEPIRCDPCEERGRIRRDYASDPAMARRIYGAPDAEAAIRLIVCR